MAFGKDNSHLQTIPSFGQATIEQQMALSDQKRRPGGGGGGIWWKNTFHISDNPANPSKFRLLRGEYEQEYNYQGQLATGTFPYYIFVKHYQSMGRDKPGKQGICSAGPLYMDKKHRKECYACDKFWEEYEQRQADRAAGGDGKHPNSMSLIDQFAWNVLDYGYFFEMPDVDARGQVRTNKEGKPYMVWEKALNTNDPKYQGKKWKEGNVCSWPISKSWREDIMSLNTVIGQRCGSCGTGHITTQGWYCGNAQCRQFIFDPLNTSMTTEQQQSLSRNPFQCPHCGLLELPYEHVICNTCQQARKANIFDADLWGFKQKNSSNSKGTHLTFTNWTLNTPAFQTGQATEIKLLDLPKIFAPTPLEVQAKIWNVPGARQAVQQDTGVPPAQPGVWSAPPAPPTQQGAQLPVAQQQPAPMPQHPTPTQATHAPQPQPVDTMSLAAQLAALSNGN